MKKIAIIGAAGYVGQYVVDEFNAAGIVPTTITRENGLFLLAQKKVRSLLIEDVEAPTFNEKFDIVINLAYPTGTTYLIKNKNDQLINIVRKLTDKHTKIIHTSTIAVFGFKLNHEINTGRVKNRHDWDYVESKIYFENQLLSNFKNNEIHIVRLGNVWGPGSGNWTVSLVNNILYNQPTAVFGKDGFSNITDVANAANYIKFLSDLNEPQTETFHHLAEFYDIRWSYWLNKFSNMFGMPIRYLYRIKDQKETTTITGDVKNVFAGLSFKKLLKQLYLTKVAGSYIRGIVPSLPAKVFKVLDNANIRVKSEVFEEVSDPIFFTILEGQIPFENKTHQDWTPPLTKEQSWSKVENWVNSIKLTY